MTFTTVPTALTGDVWTAAMHDTYVRDNLNAGVLRPIASEALTATATTVSFTGFTAADFLLLRLILNSRGTTSATSTGLTMTFNASASGYAYRRFWGNATTATSDSSTSAAYILGLGVPADTATASVWGTHIIDIYQPAATSARVASWTATYKRATTTGNLYAGQGGGYWSNTTDPITTITFGLLAGDFAIGSTFDLYGMGVI